jgi:HEAT repeat protein
VELQAAAIGALADGIDGLVLEHLAHAPDARLRRAALSALRARSETRLGQVISELLEDKSVAHRLSAMEAMRFSEGTEIRSRLLRLLEEDPTPECASRGRTALRFLRVRGR